MDTVIKQFYSVFLLRMSHRENVKKRVHEMIS